MPCTFASWRKLSAVLRGRRGVKWLENRDHPLSTLMLNVGGYGFVEVILLVPDWSVLTKYPASSARLTGKLFVVCPNVCASQTLRLALYLNIFLTGFLTWAEDVPVGTNDLLSSCKKSSALYESSFFIPKPTLFQSGRS